ncbi:hypothetical protein PFUGPA_04356 [Plasmodium falciparum Palo Alto/Uganda]|uniref:Rifin n=1 Tax=Plasmodium falciparum (isolate Palo Alto / Uganda) TaxID=57270 RepID=W4IWY7_PLAFP|nr:hypothetical protein PFUGPA_04356 [Plasmodium falciparum Palo Alto/Uganda]
MYYIYNQRNHYITRTPKTNTRTLCECELYAPSNYDNDSQMKEVMQQFEDRTTQRFHEYDERMKTTRQKCKEQCNKEIQKIILKDKLEKELMDKIVTLDTDIQSDAIPACVCEKSLADKVEKNCMKCTQNLGGIVAPSSGVLAGIAEGALYAWKPTAIAAAMELAKQAGAAAGKIAGDAVGAAKVVQLIQSEFSIKQLGTQTLQTAINVTNYTNESHITQAVFMQYQGTCLPGGTGAGAGLPPAIKMDDPICKWVWSKLESNGQVLRGDALRNAIKKNVETIVSKAEDVAGATEEMVTQKATATLTAQKTSVVETTYMGYQGAIIASIVAILVIVLVMVIIYLILRYRRKKKMKKKLQYIKLLKE